MIVRFQGGANAGHTVVVGDDRYAFHLVPSGILRYGKKCVIANGVVVDPAMLLEEISALSARGVEIGDNLILSDRAHVVMPYHKLLDGLWEDSLGSGKIGTTKRGIGPCYVDKMSRCGIRVVDLFRPDSFRRMVAERLERLNKELVAIYGMEPLRAEEVAEEVLSYAPQLQPHVTDTVRFINEALDSGARLLFEGAQGCLLDVDFGTYPFVTSSNSSACGVSAGAGIGPTRISEVVGVAKAYTTRVGGGPFPTELKGKLGEALREKGGEYGTTTGRPRRCGWFDACATAYAVSLNALDSVALTKLDVLSGQRTVAICTAYQLPGGRRADRFPSAIDDVVGARAVYEEMPGWSEDISAARSVSDLPRSTRAYVERLQELVGRPICMISVGKGRDDTILCEGGV
jgi:adenylosuccinate synthase